MRRSKRADGEPPLSHCVSLLFLKLSREWWGGPLGPRPTPTSACFGVIWHMPDQGVRRGRGRPPHNKIGTFSPQTVNT
jgi:hypothetical protein